LDGYVDFGRFVPGLWPHLQRGLLQLRRADQPLLGDAAQPHGPCPTPCSSHHCNSFHFAKVCHHILCLTGVLCKKQLKTVLFFHQDFYPRSDQYPPTHGGDHCRKVEEEGEGHKEDAGQGGIKSRIHQIFQVNFKTWKDGFPPLLILLVQ
jgi:hypothetical protein